MPLRQFDHRPNQGIEFGTSPGIKILQGRGPNGPQRPRHRNPRISVDREWDAHRRCNVFPLLNQRAQQLTNRRIGAHAIHPQTRQRRNRIKRQITDEFGPYVRSDVVRVLGRKTRRVKQFDKTDCR